MNNQLPQFKHLSTDTLVTLHREVGEEINLRREAKEVIVQGETGKREWTGVEPRFSTAEVLQKLKLADLAKENRFIPLGDRGIEVGTAMVLAMKHDTAGKLGEWIKLLQTITAGVFITVEHPIHGDIQRPIQVDSVKFFDIDKDFRDWVMLIQVSEGEPARTGDRHVMKFYTSYNENLLDRDMVPVVEYDMIKVQPPVNPV